MGLGLVFMESFMDEMILESEPGKGTRVVMRKNRNGVKAMVETGVIVPSPRLLSEEEPDL